MLIISILYLYEFRYYIIFSFQSLHNAGISVNFAVSKRKRHRIADQVL